MVRNLLTGLDRIEPLVRFAEQHPELVPAAGSGRAIKQLLVQALAFALWRQLGDFDAMDTNHDGRIDAGEIAVAITRFLAEPASEVTVGLVLRALDVDRDQLVSREEDAAARPRNG